MHNSPSASPGDLGNAPKLCLLLLGPMAAHDGQGRDVLPRVRKTRAVLAALALSSPKPLVREDLTRLLWSKRGPSQARASLRQCIHELHDMLLPLGENLFSAQRSHLTLRADRVWIDLHALGTGTDANLGLLRGPLLQDLAGLDVAFDRWLERQRQRAAAIARAAAAEMLSGAAGADRAIYAASMLAAANPTDEIACRTLMSALQANGESQAAERAFMRFRMAISGSSGRVPTPETQALIANIRADAPEQLPPGARTEVRIGIMPFETTDPSGEDPLSLGLAEEITAALARFRGIACLASTSLAHVANGKSDLASAMAAIDLDFLLAGTIRRDGNKVMVDMRLLDMSAEGKVAWSRRFEEEATDLFSLQDNIAAEVAAQIDPALLLREVGRIGCRSGTHPSAHELTLRAIPAVYRLDRAGYLAAGSMLEEAIATDPSYSAAHAWLAYWHLFLVGQGWADDPAASNHRAGELAEKAVLLDPGDARALTLAGHVRAFLDRRAGEAIALHEKALSLNPNLVAAWVFSSLAYTYTGSPDQGLRRARRAKQLAPFDPHGFMADAATMLSLLMKCDFAGVAGIGRIATDVAPGFSTNWKLLACALGHLSFPEAAQRAVDALLQLEPGFTVQEALDRCPLLRPHDLALYGEGLRRAGLPEGTVGRR